MTLKQLKQNINESTPVSLGIVGAVIVAAITLSYWIGRGQENFLGRLGRVETIAADHENRIDVIEGRILPRAARNNATMPAGQVKLPIGEHSILAKESKP